MKINLSKSNIFVIGLIHCEDFILKKIRKKRNQYFLKEIDNNKEWLYYLLDKISKRLGKI